MGETTGTVCTGVDVPAYLTNLGYKSLSSDWYSKIEEWRTWYKGKVKEFHSYKQYNGTSFVGRERQTLGMAKKVCEDKADLLLNERCSINLGNAAAQKYLDQVLEDTQFWVRGNQLIELMAALGSGAFVEYLDHGKVEIDCIQANMIYPLAWNNGKITECAFASEFNRKNGRYTYINMHVLNEQGNYEVRNEIFDPDGNKCDPQEGDPVPVFDTKSPVPLFQIVKLNAVNNIDTSNPMGVSVFANAIDILKGIDLVYDSYDNEFRLGKKRIFVRDSVMRVTTNAAGEAVSVPVFDDNDTEFYALDMKDTEDSIKEVDMELRAEPHEVALQRRLDLLSEKCGFGKGYYQALADSVQTATGVISQNSQLYRRIKKDELVLDGALTGLVRGVFALSPFAKPSVNLDPKEISNSFDDSIVEDTDAVSKRSMAEHVAGIISAVEYLKRVYKLTDTEAEKIYAEAKEETPPAPPEPNTDNLFPEQPPEGGPGAEEKPQEDDPSAVGGE